MVLRTWDRLCDLSPDYSPILGATELESFHLSAGWGTYGSRRRRPSARRWPSSSRTGRTPGLIAPFALERFYTDTLVSELAAAAVSH
jgi:sarcosine oxidase subunit beta